MTPKLTNANYIDGYKIEVIFSDGKSAIIDLENELWGEVFEPLKDLARFRKFVVDPELKTIVWPNGADLAPEYLYQHVAA